MAVLVPVFGVPGSWKRSAAGAGIAAAIAVGVTGVWPVTAPAAAADEAEPVSCSVERTAADGVSAMLTAKLSGCRIEDLSQRTETSSTFARPDGDWDVTYAMSPVWVRTGGDGTATEDWAALNVDLRADDEGDLEPAAHPAGIWVSGRQAAGDDGVSVVASLTDPKTEVTSEVTWPGDLPEPEVTGPRARYLDVEQGVDMVVDVTGGGVEQYFVLHEVPTDAGQVELPVGVQSQDATVVDTSQDAQAVGLADLVTADGEQDETVVARVGTPLVWDATYDDQLAHPVLADYDPADDAPLWAGAISDLDAADIEPDAEEPGLLDKMGAAVADAVNGEPEPLDLGEVAEAPAQVDIASGGESADITLGLSDDFAQAAATGPVVVDPSVSLALPWDTYVQSDSSVDKSLETELRLGTFDGGTTKARTFMNVDALKVIGKSVRSATLTMWEHHSYSCTPSEWQVWNAARVPGAITWSSQPTIGSQHGSSTATKGHSASCEDGWVTMDMTSLARAWSTDSETERGMLLRAASETDSNGWKRFNSTNAATGKPTITVTLNTAPATPGSTSLASGTYNWYPSSSATNRELYVKTVQPVFSTVVSDPDGDRVRSSVTLVEGSTTILADGVGGYVASGGTSKYTTGTGLLAQGRTYSANVRAYDGLLASARKDLWTFKVDTAKPGTPTVTASGYTNGQWKDTKPSSNTFTFTSAATDVVKFEYSADGGAWTTVAASGTTPTATFAWNPAAGAHTLKLRSVDKANWTSLERTFTFGSGGASISTPTSGGLKSTSTVPVKATGPAPASGTVTAQVLWRVGGGAEPADFSQTNGSRTGWTAIEGTVPVTTTGSSITVNSTLDAAGIAKGLGRERKATMLNVQVCFTYDSPATTRCSWTADAKSKATATYVPHAFGDSFPTAEAGPGQVALWTGEFATDATDVGFGDFAVGRSYATYDQPAAAAGVFGPGWVSMFDDASAGSAAMQVADDTTFDGTISLTAGYGTPFVFAQPGTTRAERKPGVYTPVGSEDWGDRLEVKQPDANGRGTVLTLTESDGTVTTWNWAGGTWRATSVSGVDDPGEFRFDYDGQGRMTRMAAPVPEGDGVPVSCNAGAEQRGCRVLTVAYGSTNAGTDATPGDRAGQIKQVSYTAWDPAISAMKTTVVATYAYNSSGLLVKVTDPRSNLSTAYTYSGTSSAGVPLLTGVTPAGLAGWTLLYGSSTQDPKSSLITVSRDGATTSAPSVRTSRFVYGINPAGAVDGLPGMTDADVAVWDQQAAPVYGAAVFEQDKAGDVPSSTVGNVTAAMWPFADLFYTDDQGRVINTASHGGGGWQVTATGYDEAGRVVRTLDARAIDQIRSQAAEGAEVDPDTYATLTAYNQDIVSAAPATGPGDEEATVPAGTVIIPAGTVATDTWYPATEVTDPDTGETRLARAHVHSSYDQGAPNNGVDPLTGLGFTLPTTTTITQVLLGAEGATEAVTSEARQGYSPIDGADPLGDTSGWILGELTTTDKEMGPGGTDIVSKTRFDRYGREVERRQPKSSGADAGTTLTGYYTAGPQTGTFATCGGRPEWDGLPCQTRTPESSPTTPVSTIEYGYYQDPTKTTEARGSVTRTSTQTYLADGRTETSKTVTSGLAGSEPVPGTKTVYDSATGLPTATVSLNSSGSETGRISTTYDRWSRPVTYTDSDGQITTTAYDSAGNVASVADPDGARTYTYDSATEHRGLVTGINLDGSGQINLSYDAGGRVIRQEMPGQVTQTQVYDRAGVRTGMTYDTTDAAGAPITLGAWSIGRDIAGRAVTEDTNLGTGPDGSQGRSLTFAYDNAARLAEVTDTLGGCTSTRTYGFDLNGNRTNQDATLPTVNATSGLCDTTTTTVTKIWTHDAADRVQRGATIDGQASGAYTYDQLGRQTLIPVVDTPAGSGAGDLAIGYYDTDAAHTLTQNGATTEYTLDPAGRRAVETTTSADSSRTITRHYADGSDNPTWAETTADGRTTTTWYGGSPSGDLALSITGGQQATLMLSDPRGNTALTMPVTTAEREIKATGTFDEYGNVVAPAAMSADNPLGHGWLGAHQRATTDTGLILMGARVYNPTTGTFTSTDPVIGGNTTAYAYPQDPINLRDTTGSIAVIDDLVLLVLIMLLTVMVAYYIYWYIQTYCKYGCNIFANSRAIPFPNPKAWSANRFKRTKYIVYEIYRDRGNVTFKYGISRVGVSRPKSQIKTCEKYYDGADCDHAVRLRVTGWYYARMGEAGLIYAYARVHGHCPPGQYWSCI
jgi:RHS repeat-associated protein